ncbi:MAG: hypothetical protein ACI8ZX_000738 [Planctomycetota bacterium]|jgi:hypothetical protein
MTKIFAFLVLFISFALTSCSNNVKNHAQKELIVETTPVEQAIPKIPIESLPNDLALMIFQECNSIDITFYNSDKTLNLWDDNVKHVLTMITNEAPQKLDNNVVGHIMMLKEGNQLSFVEISLKDTNNYVIYNIEDKKYYNLINAKGLEFFNRFLN